MSKGVRIVPVTPFPKFFFGPFLSTTETMFIPTANLEAITQAVRRLNVQTDEAVLLLLVEPEAFSLQDLVLALRQEGVAFFGGVFPGLIHNEALYKRGCILEKLPMLFPPVLIPRMANSERIAERFTQFKIPPEIQITGLTLIDGLSEHAGLFLDRLNNLCGEQVQFIGGGAGNKTLQPAECLFTNRGVAGKDGAVVALVRASSTTGVRHGWTHMYGPVVATDTQGNRIRDLNWGNALKLYREVVEGDANTKLTRANFLETCQRYPFGMFREGQEDIVREPIDFTDDGELICLAEVPTNSVLYILKADTDRMIRAARQAAHDAHLGYKMNRPWSKTLVFDCISRPHLLQSEFSRELASIHQEMEYDDINGVLSVGEISTYGKGVLELFNETVVVGHLYEA